MAISPQIPLRSSCLRSAGGPTRSLAAVLKKISLEGRAERVTFPKCLSIRCQRLRFSRGSQRVLRAWGLWQSPFLSPEVTFLSREEFARAQPSPAAGFPPRLASLGGKRPRGPPHPPTSLILFFPPGSYCRCLSVKSSTCKTRAAPHLRRWQAGTQRAWTRSTTRWLSGQQQRGVRVLWIQSPALPLCSRGAQAKFLHLSEPRSSHC